MDLVAAMRPAAGPSPAGKRPSRVVNGASAPFAIVSYMSPEYSYGAARKPAPKASAKPSRPNEPIGEPATGRIARLVVGHGHGFIRLPDDRQVYFHRSDSREGTAFNDLRIGDAVMFDLLEDAVSGARALRVRSRKKSR